MDVVVYYSISASMDCVMADSNGGCVSEIHLLFCYGNFVGYFIHLLFHSIHGMLVILSVSNGESDHGGGINFGI